VKVKYKADVKYRIGELFLIFISRGLLLML